MYISYMLEVRLRGGTDLEICKLNSSRQEILTFSPQSFTPSVNIHSRIFIIELRASASKRHRSRLRLGCVPLESESVS